MRERRKNFRVEWNSPATICDREGVFARFCIVRNFSNGGAKIVDPDPSALPDSSSSASRLAAVPANAMSCGVQRMG